MWMPVIWNDSNDYNTVNSGRPNTAGTENTRMMDPVDRMFRDFWGDGLQTTRSMSTDVVETDTEYKLTAEMPGIRKEDIQIDMKNGILSIAAEHHEESEQKDAQGRYIRRERHASSYHRAFRLGEEYKPEDIAAKYEDGVLTLTIPKKNVIEQKKDPTRIMIQ